MASYSISISMAGYAKYSLFIISCRSTHVIANGRISCTFSAISKNEISAVGLFKLNFNDLKKVTLNT